MDKSFDTLRAVADWFVGTDLGHMCLALLALVYLLAWWRIFWRAGYPGALACLMLVPPIALVLWMFLAFAPWPARRELAALRKVQRVVHQADRRRLVA